MTRDGVGPEAGQARRELLSTAASHPRQLNYERVAWVTAAVESATYLVDRMARAVDLGTADKVREHAMGCCRVDGLVMEFGVNTGRSLAQIASLAGQDVHGFDSFEGLPEDWTHFQKKGRFSRGGLAPDLDAPNVRLHRGWFDQTLPSFLADHRAPARFVHVDCDLYTSATTVLTELDDRVVPGTVIVFDEYLNYPGWRNHEHKAWAEFIARTGRRYEYIGFASSVCAVSVQVV